MKLYMKSKCSTKNLQGKPIGSYVDLNSSYTHTLSGYIQRPLPRIILSSKQLMCGCFYFFFFEETNLSLGFLIVSLDLDVGESGVFSHLQMIVSHSLKINKGDFSC